MIRESSTKQITLSEFDWPFGNPNPLDAENRWVELSRSIPWDALSQAYHKNLNQRHGRPALNARVVIGALIIKHKLVLSDRETVEQIQENPYMQYFIGKASYSADKPFDASLFVSIRRRMGQEVFDEFSQSVIDQLDKVKRGSDAKAPDSEPDDEVEVEALEDDGGGVSAAPDSTDEQLQGKLILDATVAEQAIRFPTDVSLLNEAREFTEQIIDKLFAGIALPKKPRTYREKARREYLGFVKRRRPGAKAIRKAIKQQLQYVRRNLKHIEVLLNHYEEGKALPLPNWLLRRYWVIPHMYDQQKQMHDQKVKRCDDRIVSLSQPWVRPIVRGKQHKPTEFGAKFNVSMDAKGIAHIDHFSWDAFNEGQDLPDQVEAYKARHGDYPEVVLADPIYGTRQNRVYLKERGIRYGGKPLGRPRKQTEENAEELKAEKKQRQADYRQRIPIEGKFGQGKAGYRLNYIKAKRADTSQAWINSIFFVMNLLVLYRVFFWPLFIRSRRGLQGLCTKWRVAVVYLINLRHCQGCSPA